MGTLSLDDPTTPPMALRGPRRALVRLDDAMVDAMRAHGILVLRYALGLVFVWFGALKLVGRSPVEDLILAVSYAIPARVDFVLVFGVWEVLIGLGLLFALMLRTTLFLLWLQLAGTFLVLVIRPDIAFQGGNPLLLTSEGEFVVKNVVLLSASLVIGGTVRHRRGGGGEGHVEPDREGEG